VTFRYRVYFHQGTTAVAGVAARYDSYVAGN
jgi:hypothetical protein